MKKLFKTLVSHPPSLVLLATPVVFASLLDNFPILATTLAFLMIVASLVYAYKIRPKV